MRGHIIMRIIKSQLKKILAFTTASFMLAACGGSDTGSTAPNRPALPPVTPAPSTGTITPIVDNQSLQIFGELETVSGSAMGFAVIPKGNLEIDEIKWEQISGPRLIFLADNSQTIGFDVPSSDNYSLQVSVQMQGESNSTNYLLNFSAASGQDSVSIRLDHTATELTKVSLHVGVPSNKTIAFVNWQQLAGPEAQNIESSSNPEGEYLFFDAPSVTRDAVISYRATVTFEDGSEASDDVLVTVSNANFNSNGLFYIDNSVVTEDMFAYQAASPYKNAIEKCVYNNNIPNPPTCTFTELPLIGMQTLSPSVNDILDRTLVSHKWMGDRFAEYLQTSLAGPDMLNLLRGVTAVIISYDVRPSFYWQATGAIYLDAKSFWQTPEERDTLNDQPDYRSDFGRDLKFDTLWRYTKDNRYFATTFIDKNDRQERAAADVAASISWLLYHELAHANDFFPSTAWDNIAGSTTPLAYFRNNRPSSDTLDIRFPLRSSELHALASVRFGGETASNIQRNYRGTDIERFFAPDIAASFYSYLTSREDFATLFERYMMLYRLDAEADEGIIDGKTPDNEPLVVWGQRNRITQLSLEDRTVFAVERVYPELSDVRATLRNLPDPVQMTANIGWFENLVISPESSNQTLNSNRYRNATEPFSRAEMKFRLYQDSEILHKQKPDLN